MDSQQNIIITDKRITKEQLNALCKQWFEDMVKVVVDVEREMVAIGGELHADAEALLIEKGSNSKNIWGANFYPWHTPEDRIEFTALINICPNQNNPSMEILDNDIKTQLKEIIEKNILGPDEELV